MSKKAKTEKKVRVKVDEKFLANHGTRKEVSFSKLSSDFSKPKMIYAPFSWLIANKKITKKDSEPLNELVSASIEQGANPGYLFCPLEPGRYKKEVFLSDEYFEVFGKALRIAQKSGAHFSYCDEWTWPSGQAYGNVLAKYPELKAQTLHYEIREVRGGEQIHVEESFFTVVAKCEGPIGSKSSKISSSTLRVISRGSSLDWEVPPGLWRIYRFYKRPVNMKLGHGESDINYLDRRLPESFIELAHRPYEDRYKEHLGKTIPGFFMDHEGSYGWKLAWSDDLDNEYRQKKGRDIRLWMPLMIHRDVEGVWAKARWDWHDAVSDLYADNFFKEVSRWAADRGMYHAIHFYEEGLGAQAALMGSMFKLLRVVSMPAIDCLADAALWVRQFKEAQSVAEFEGRLLMCECFGAHGWNLSPEQMKKEGNSMTAYGVSHVLQASSHVERDLSKVIFGPDLPAMPYARYLEKWNDFMRRTSYINAHGHMVPDVLIMSPIDSVWAAAGGDRFDAGVENFFKGKEGQLLQWWPFQKPVSGVGIKVMDGGEYIDYLEKVYTGLIEDLDALNVESFIADSEYIKSMDVQPGGTLKKGDFSFRAVILPPMIILPESIALKLLSFAQKGGEVYIMGGAPVGSTEEGLGYALTGGKSEDRPESIMSDMLDGMLSMPPGNISGISTAMRRIMAKLISLPNVYMVEKSIYPFCKKSTGLEPKIEFLCGEFPVLLQHRRIDGRDFYWMANNTGIAQKARVKFRTATGAVNLWDCETGDVKPLHSEPEGAGSVLSLEFGPCEGYWLVFDPSKPPTACTASIAAPCNKSSVNEITSEWKIYIDMADQPPAFLPGFIPDLPKELLKENGGINDSLKFWSEWGLTQFNGLVTYEAEFTLEHDAGKVFLNLGRLTHFADVWINGKHSGTRIWPPYRFDISGQTVKGKNNLKVVVGNLLCNPKPSKSINGSFIEWKEKPEDSDAGLIGPVTVCCC